MIGVENAPEDYRQLFEMTNGKSTRLDEKIFGQMIPFLGNPKFAGLQFPILLQIQEGYATSIGKIVSLVTTTESGSVPASATCSQIIQLLTAPGVISISPSL